MTARTTFAFYRTARASTRAHLRVRWASCPFPKVAAVVPTEGRVLEVGCGHGLFSMYLAAGSARREVRGIDLDGAKIEEAQAAAVFARERGARVSFDPAPSGAVPEGPWAAIVIVDVLYLLDPDGQRRLLADCAERLATGGVLVVKEMSDKPRWKFLVNLVQETLSVRVLGITAGRDLNFLTPREIAQVMRSNRLEVTHRRLDRGRPHPHHLVVGRKPSRDE